MMNQSELIDTLSANALIPDIFPDLTNWKDTYRAHAALIHPDVCKLPGATAAFARLSSLKDELERGKTYRDDGGTATFSLGLWSVEGDAELLDASYKNYQLLYKLKNPAADNFRRYMPPSAEHTSSAKLTFALDKRAIPISALPHPLPDVHVNWITSRMLEYAAWVAQEGYSHAGLNPDSVLVVPESHGIRVVGYYHMKKLGTQLSTVSGKYAQFYDASVFVDKTAVTSIDLESVKRTSLWMLGDKSGNGTALRKTVNVEILEFLQKRYDEPFQCYKDYRELLKKHYPVKFHELKV